MRQYSRSSFKAACAVLAAAGIAFLVQNPLSAPPQAAGSDPAAATGAATPSMEVNRALKGDRLRVILRPEGAEPFDVQQAPPAPAAPSRSLPDGCESAFGPINPATKPARCVT